MFNYFLIPYLFTFFSLTGLNKAFFHNVHEFHVSNCEIEHLSAEKSITIVLHIFIDDLELNLKNMGFDSLYIATEKESQSTNEILALYFDKKLALTADAAKLDFKFLGKETSEDLMAIWCYLEATDVPDFKKLQIENRILLDTHSDQKNITSFLKSNGKKIHFLFEKGDETQSIEY